MTYRWDYRSSPYVRVGFWLLLLLAGFALAWAGKTEVKIYTAGEGQLEVDASRPRLFWVRLSQADLTKVQVGMPATIAWIAYPRAQFGLSQGRVQEITLADQDTNVAIALDSLVLKTANRIQPLQPGLSGTAQIILNRKKALELLWDWLRGH
jgi:hypothetical protein